MSTFLTRCLSCTAIQCWQVGAAMLWQTLAGVTRAPSQVENGGNNGRPNDMVVWEEDGPQATAASRGAQLCGGHLVASGDHRDVACPRRDSNVWPRVQPTANANAVALPGRAL